MPALRMRRMARKSRWASWLDIRNWDVPQNTRPKTKAPLTKKRPYCCGNESCVCSMIGVLLGSIQRLVFAKIRDGKTERVDLNEVIANRVTEGEYEMGSVLRPFDCAAIERRFIDQLKFHCCLVRGGAQVFD